MDFIIAAVGILAAGYVVKEYVSLMHWQKSGTEEEKKQATETKQN